LKLGLFIGGFLLRNIESALVFVELELRLIKALLRTIG
jgi:hypothetical protein